MRVYISGAITHTRGYMERFQRGEDYMRKQGHETVNPAKVCESLPRSFWHEDYMDVCMALLPKCDAIYMLKKWQRSRGACAELEWAQENNLQIFYEE